MGFIYLGLLPDQLYTLTPKELNMLAENYKLNEKKEMRRAAFIAANIMNVHTKRRITIEKLLGEDTAGKKKISKEEREIKLSEIEELERLINGR